MNVKCLMATVVPSRIPSRATVGEIKLHEVLGRLPEDWVVYYEPDLDGIHPDFVVIAPDLGVIIIEDKFWRPSTILSGDKSRIKIKTNAGPKSVIHPLRQVREYNFRLQEIAASTRYGRRFVHQSGPHMGRLRIPVTHIVTLSNITHDQLHDPSRNISPIFDRDKTITRDVLQDWLCLSPEQLASVFRGFFADLWGISPMTDEEVNAIRAIIHPEINFENAFSVDDLLSAPRPIHDQLDVLKALDLRQEEAARSLGEGHRIIYGVAGSGKTVLLLTRARLLAAKDSNSRILIVCYNRELCRWMAERVRSIPQITVLTFHSLCFRNGVEFSKHRSDKQWGEALECVFEEGSRDAGAFDAILVDEAQDFEPSWFTSLLKASKDPENGDLLIVADGAQSLYRRSGLSWKSLGIKAMGRSHSKRFDLDQNYRNSSEILSLAETFATRSDMDDSTGEDDRIQAIRVDPRRSVRSTGAAPLLFLKESKQSELDTAIGLIQRLTQGCWASHQTAPLKPSEIAILYPCAGREQKRDLAILPSRIYNRCAVGARWVSGGAVAGDPDNQVTIQTIHSSKGLQYRAVIIIWAGGPYPWCQADESDRSDFFARRLLYVAMTRAESYLAITASGHSPYIADIRDSPACTVYESQIDQPAIQVVG